ncbi:MAG: tryptophan synthase subunit alpha, partial [Candidatus Binatia bacterium]|nr:tryptophan synthase subunit alpha [Candidatus Binatia bacterium]
MKSYSKRLRSCFRRLQKKNEAAFIPFLMAGDPNLDATEEMAMALVDEGADILEIGVPFSDPMAD